ncbi:hypothetical protein NECAME_16300 [Necator americanus]|uniref:Uncharacterized protein n=1 Tax=Necator americanus TaxID=51031 RepID=W2TZM7_NECAM|nr:hypothetical protein NECAME_16300 [Necator americanus]ETN86497.1 hypothetical protein NECAME_16300 [Necator americanus]
MLENCGYIEDSVRFDAPENKTFVSICGLPSLFLLFSLPSKEALGVALGRDHSYLSSLLKSVLMHKEIAKTTLETTVLVEKLFYQKRPFRKEE